MVTLDRSTSFASDRKRRRGKASIFNRANIPTGIFKQYDMWILLPALCLALFGLLMVTSASMVISDRQFGYSLHYFIRQAIFILFSMGGMSWL